jgi:hypothetical protein
MNGVEKHFLLREEPTPSNLEEEKGSQHFDTLKTLKKKPTHIITTTSILTKSTNITLPNPINIMLPCRTRIVKAMVVV